MIIESLQSDNILKYRQLRLNQLPATGTIAIFGVNESGKTAIVETIALALFGRTFQIDASQLDKVILWGESDGRVELAFCGNEGNRYRIERSFDIDRRVSARLLQSDSGEILAQGPRSVQEQIERLIGFNYSEFVDSIYLAQRDAANHHPSHHTAGAIAGVEQMQQLIATLTEQIEANRHHHRTLSQQLTEIKQQLQEHHFAIELQSSPSPLEREAMVEQLARRHQHLQQQLEGLRQVSGEFDALPQSAQPLSHWLQQLTRLTDHYQQLSFALQEPHPWLLPLQQRLSDMTQRFGQLQQLQQRCSRYITQLQISLGEIESGDEQEEPPLPQQRQQGQRQLTKYQRQRRRHFRLSGLFGLLGLIPATLFAMIHAGIETTLPAPLLSPLLQPYLLPISAILLLLALLLLIVAHRTKPLIGRQQQHNLALEQQIAIYQQQLRQLQRLEQRPIFTLAERIEESEAETLLEALQQLKATPAAELLHPAGCQLLATELHDSSGQLQQQLESEVARLALGVECYRTKETILNRQSELRLQNATREVAIELLHGASRQAMVLFNQDMKRFISRVMPQLTDNRYHFLQLSESLEVTIFSQQKHDFVRWEEISAGTQQQVLLSLRLALVAALAEGSGEQNRQCVILDEPFAFYDSKRLRGAIDTLPHISPKLSQFWIIGQEFADMSPFALTIHTQREVDQLTISGHSRVVA